MQFGVFVPGLSALKHHFNVSNSYVIHKLRLVLFPWRHRSWTRKVNHAGGDPNQTVAVQAYGQDGKPIPGQVVPAQGQQGLGQIEWVPPREDINAPDLYIPSEYATFVLHCFQSLSSSPPPPPLHIGLVHTDPTYSYRLLKLTRAPNCK
jgi:hypothetical protein